MTFHKKKSLEENIGSIKEHNRVRKSDITKENRPVKTSQVALLVPNLAVSTGDTRDVSC